MGLGPGEVVEGGEVGCAGALHFAEGDVDDDGGWEFQGLGYEGGQFYGVISPEIDCAEGLGNLTKSGLCRSVS